MPVIEYVFPLLVCPYARIVQLKPSRKRETSGRAVPSNSSYCVVAGGCTWSKVKDCFLAAELAAEAGDAEDPVPVNVPEGGSMTTEVEEVVWMTER